MTIAAHPDLHSVPSPLARLARSAAAVSISPRRGLQLALAVLWLLDAGLQYQPYMFTKGFVTSTLAPAAQGNPAVIAGPMRWAFHLLAGHPAVFNLAFATVQLAIGAGLLWPRTVKAALVASVGWAAGVWWLGEGLGGVLSGASPVMGAPGAVILYALAAVLLWPRSEIGDLDAVADGGALGRRGAQAVWAALWGVTGYLFLLPANRAPGALHDAVAGMASGEPAWVGGLDGRLAGVLTGATASVMVGAICYLIAVSVFLPRLARSGIAAAAAVGALLWVAQAFGGIFTGKGTDPNSGLVLVLLAAAFRPPARRRAHAAAADRLVAPPQPRWVDRRPAGVLAAVALAATAVAAGLGLGPAGNAFAGPGIPAGMAMASHAPSSPAPSSYSPTPPGTAASPASHQSGAVGSGQPSESSQMVCSAEVQRDIATALALPSAPVSTSNWADHLYTCTYRLSRGPLVIAVKELDGVPAAKAYFARMRQYFPGAQPILGLASLGLPGYQSASGAVIFLKDDKVLTVDATAMTGPIGPHQMSSMELSYQIATDILGCWSGK